MGASKAGDIKELCEIAEPTHGIITTLALRTLKVWFFEVVIQQRLNFILSSNLTTEQFSTTLMTLF